MFQLKQCDRTGDIKVFNDPVTVCRNRGLNALIIAANALRKASKMRRAYTIYTLSDVICNEME